MELFSAVRVASYICGLGIKKEKRARAVKAKSKMQIRWLGFFLCILVLLTGCSELGIGAIQETSPTKYGEWEKYHTAPSFLPQKIDDYTVNAYSYTLYNYLDTCYEIFLDITGLEFTLNILYAIVFIIPVSILFIALGLLCGSVFTDKQVGGICGALLTNLSAWLSGIWFDLELVGGVFQKIANLLPFVHAVELERAVLAGNFADIFPHLWWVLGYAVVSLVAAVLLFLRQMKRQ